MSRIADAHRRLGHRTGGDAEASWRDACRAADSFELPSMLTLQREVPIAPGTLPIARHTAPTFRRALAALTHRVFDPPPFGAGLRCAMFCSAELDGAAAITRAVADRLDGGPASPRAAIVRIGDGVSPTVTANQAGVRILSASAIDAYDRVPELRARFGYVLVDAQLTATCTEALPVASLVDGVILVVSERTTSRKAARDMVDLLAAADIALVGAVLADRSYPIPQALYDAL